MTAPQTFRKKPVEIQAVQWDGSHQRANELWEWTAHRFETASGLSAVGQRFVVLGEDESYEQFNCFDDDMEVASGNRVDEWRGGGYTAALYVEANGEWLPIVTGEWVIKDSAGCYPCKPDIFEATYDRVENVLVESVLAEPDDYQDWLREVQG